MSLRSKRDESMAIFLDGQTSLRWLAMKREVAQNHLEEV